MIFMERKILFIITLLFLVSLNSITQSIPYLKKQGTAVQLIVDNKPFLILGGELGNSTAADSMQIKAVFSTLKIMKLNTVLVPVYWELIEPEQGEFDFSLIDILLSEARKENLKLVLLWFGSWKNSMSCYAPSYLKINRSNFPYAETSDGKRNEIMSVFSNNNLTADKQAYVTLMQYLKTIDSKDNTVIMMQVENEIGMIPEAREKGVMADRLFKSDIPEGLMNYLNTNRKTLHTHLFNKWSSSGFSLKGNWETIFGNDVFTEEIFQAWHFARYTEEVAKAGKAVYNLPVFVNAALNTRDRKPGEYPSGGPLPHLFDVWRAGAPSIDFFAPDIYDPPFAYWCKQYDVKGNPLFIPETLRGDHTAARVFYVFGEHNTIGFCPFSIESTDKPIEESLVKSYELLEQLSPVLSSVQGKNKTKGFWFHSQNLSDTVRLGEFIFYVSHDYTLGWSPGSKQTKVEWPETGALIIQMSDSDYIVVGTGVVIRCVSINQPKKKSVGILSCDKGRFEDGKWIPVQRLNGDETHQGRHVRIPFGDFDIQRFSLYKY